MILSKKEQLLKENISEDIDEIIVEIHKIYQSIEFTEDIIESMCEESNLLMKKVTPEKLIQNYVCPFGSLLLVKLL